mgnify:CR=1 FL=1
MNGFYIEVNKADVAYVQKKLIGAEKKVPRVLRSAINQTATLTLRKIKQDAQRDTLCPLQNSIKKFRRSGQILGIWTQRSNHKDVHEQ